MEFTYVDMPRLGLKIFVRPLDGKQGELVS